MIMARKCSRDGQLNVSFNPIYGFAEPSDFFLHEGDIGKDQDGLLVSIEHSLQQPGICLPLSRQSILGFWSLKAHGDLEVDNSLARGISNLYPKT